MHRITVWFMAIAAALGTATSYPLQPAISDVADSLGISVAQVGIALACGPVGYLMGLAMLVPLVDRFPPNRVLAAQFAALAVALATNAAAGTLWTLGLTIGVIGACSTVGAQLSSTTARFVPEGGRATALGIVTAGISAGIIGGRIAGGWLTEVAGWRGGLLVFAVACVVAAVVALRAVPAAGGFGLGRLSGDAPRPARPVPAIPDVAHRRGAGGAVVLRVLRGVGRPRGRAGAAAVLLFTRTDRPVRPCRSTGHCRHPHRRRVDRPCRRTTSHEGRPGHRGGRRSRAGGVPFASGGHPHRSRCLRRRVVRRPSGQSEHDSGHRPRRAGTVQQRIHGGVLRGRQRGNGLWGSRRRVAGLAGNRGRHRRGDRCRDTAHRRRPCANCWRNTAWRGADTHARRGQGATNRVDMPRRVRFGLYTGSAAR